MTRNATVLLCFVLAAFAAHAGELTVKVLDVGQGDSILIRTPADKAILIDAGDDPHEVGRLLKERHVEHLDLVVATHRHADHIGGMLDVVSQIQTKLYTVTACLTPRPRIARSWRDSKRSESSTALLWSVRSTTSTTGRPSSDLSAGRCPPGHPLRLERQLGRNAPSPPGPLLPLRR